MDTKVLFEKAIAQATTCINHVTHEQLTNSTPCSEWNLQALLNHLVYEVLWVPDLLAGKTVAEVGSKYDGNVLGKNFKKAWKQASDLALKVVATANNQQFVELSYGKKSVDHYLGEIAGDVLIHTWDVAQSIHCSLKLNKALVEAVYHNTLPRKDEFTASGLFGKPLSVSSDADVQTKLLALVGRQETKA